MMVYFGFSYLRFFVSVLLCIIGGVGLYISELALIRSSQTPKTVWLIDNSLSMAIEDISVPSQNQRISRLDLAKKLVQKGINTLPGMHAVIVYAKNPAVLTPLSPDTEYITPQVAGIIPVFDNGGSDITAALSLVKVLYPHDEDLTLYILTDGGDSGTREVVQLPYTDIRIIGLGTELGGPIPLGYDALGQRRYKYYKGKEITVGYDAKRIGELTDSYRASLEEYQSYRDDGVYFSPEDHLQLSTESRSSIFFLSAFVFLVGTILHPYVKKHHS